MLILVTLQRAIEGRQASEAAVGDDDGDDPEKTKEQKDAQNVKQRGGRGTGRALERGM